MIVVIQKRWWVAVAVVFLVLVNARGALCAKVQEFTADNVILGADGQIKSVNKVYFSRDKMRSDIDMEGRKMVIIYRRDKKQLWAFNPGKKIYVQQPLDEKEWKQKTTGMSENAKILGKETVNGYRCTKKEVTNKLNIMGREITTHRTVWISDKFDMPIRTSSQNGMVTELRNIKVGSPPASVFEIPQGYKKIGNNVGMLMIAMHGEQMPAAGKQFGGHGGGEMHMPFKLPKGMKMP